MRRFKSLRWRLTLWYALVLGFIFVVSDVVLYRYFKANLLETLDDALYTAAEEVAGDILKTPRDKWWDRVKLVERGFLVNRLFIQVVEAPRQKDGDVTVAARSGILAGNISQKEIWTMLEGKLPTSPIYLNIGEGSPGTHPLRLLLFPAYDRKSGGYLIQAAASLKKISSVLMNLRVVLVVSGPILLIVSVLGGFFILTGALGPVQEVVHTARKISTEDLSHRIHAGKRKDEIGQLITTFNSMIARLERSVKQIKQFSGDASHDLKTPLTIIRGEVDIALRKKRQAGDYIKTLDSIKEEAVKMDAVIDNLLFLSQIDSDDYPRFFTEVSLDEVVLEVFETFQPLAAEKSVACHLGKVAALTVSGERLLLSRLVMNLVDNAIKYTPAKGTVTINLEKVEETALLTVSDTGPGISNKELPYIFDRFYRVDASRTRRSQGSGLGLSIVKKIAGLHNASVDIRSPAGKGTTAAITFLLYKTMVRH